MHSILITVIISAFAAILGLWLAKRATDPIAALSRGAKSIQTEDFDSVVDVRSGYKEIQETADSFTAMQSAIRESQGKLIAYRDQLEDRVKEQTTDLQHANDNLRVEIEQRQESDRALHESEDRYRTILESIEEGYFEIDLKGNLGIGHVRARRPGLDRNEGARERP